MSLLKSIKQQLGLGPAAENHFWDGSVANQLTLKRGTPDAPGATVLQAVNGVLSFPNQGQSLTPNGYVKLPGGLIIQWGNSLTNASGVVTVTFPIAFVTACLQTSATSATPARIMTAAGPLSVTSVDFYSHNDSGVGTAADFRWIAIGY